MDVDDDGDAISTFTVTPSSPDTAGAAAEEQFARLKRAVKDTPTDYMAHLALVGYLRRERPRSLDLLRAREE